MKKIPLVSIIDDDQLFQFSTKKLLESTEGVEEILQFKNGQEAINYFLDNRDRPEKIPDLVFLDLNMPVSNGWDFLDKFTSHTFEKNLITIYICTSTDSKYDHEKLNLYPELKGFLFKPIIKQEVFEVLDDELGKSESI